MSRHFLAGDGGHIDINEHLEGPLSAVLDRYATTYGVKREKLLAAIIARVLADDLVEAVLDEK
jgi:hypothetical protein